METKGYIELSIKLKTELFHQMNLEFITSPETGKIQKCFTVNGKFLKDFGNKSLRNRTYIIEDKSHRVFLSTNLADCRNIFFNHSYFKKNYVQFKLNEDSEIIYCKNAVYKKIEFDLIICFEKKFEIKHIRFFVKNIPVKCLLEDLKIMGFWFKNAKDVKEEIKKNIINELISIYNVC